MTENSEIEKSLVEQIYDDLFERLEKLEEFDAKLITKLKNEAHAGNLDKPRKLAAVLKPTGAIS